GNPSFRGRGDLLRMPAGNLRCFLRRNHARASAREIEISDRGAISGVALPPHEYRLARPYELLRHEVLVIGLAEIDLRIERNAGRERLLVGIEDGAVDGLDILLMSTNNDRR